MRSDRKKIYRFFLFLVLNIFIVLASSYADSLSDILAKDVATPGVKNLVRQENEIMLTVPKERTEEIWTFLTSTFKGEVELGGEKYNTVHSVEYFQDTYFDSPQLDLLKKWGGLRYRQRIGENGERKELVQIKLTPNLALDIKDQLRIEMKYAVTDAISKEEEKDLDLDSYQENNEILSLVNYTVRPDFKKDVSELGLKPASLRKFFSITQERRRVYFRQGASQFFTITLDIAKGKKLWLSEKLVQLEFEIGENAFTNADLKQKERLLKLQHKLESIVKEKLGEFPKDQAPKIVKLTEMIEGKGFLSHCLLRYEKETWVFLLSALILFIFSVKVFIQKILVKSQE